MQAQYAIPDPAFAAKLQDIVPFAMNGNLLDETHPSVMFRSTLVVENAGISDLDGLQFFTSLQVLNCRENPLTNIPDLPNTLRDFICNNSSLASLPSLPNSLEKLVCHHNDLVALPTLSTALEELDCHTNLLASLPTLPNSLQELDCSFNQLSSLPPLSSSLVEMDCSGNDLFSLPALPSGLDWLKASECQLGSLPMLPNSLTTLDASFNQLSDLPNTPNSLEYLYVSFNQLTSIPPLTSPLIVLDCRSNSLNGLPQLPNSIVSIAVSNNPLASLPSLPTALITLECSNTQLEGLPALPGLLSDLECENNSLLLCLPQLPPDLNSLKCTNSGISCLPNVPISFSPNELDLGFAPVECNVVNTACPLLRELITGSVFHDDNGNGIKDLGEEPFHPTVVKAQPGGYLTVSEADGSFTLPASEGTFALDGLEVPYHTKTTSAVNITLGALEVDSLNHIGYQLIPDIYDLVAALEAQPASPGLDNTLWLKVENIGTESTTASINFAFDPDQTWAGSSTIPDTQIGNNATWSPILAPGSTWSVVVTLNTAIGIPIGTAIDHTLTAIPQVSDSTLADNTAKINTEVVWAYGPNDKLVDPAFLSEAEVQGDTAIGYTIRFQNIGTTTAERLVITDTLSDDLEWNSMDFLGSSHACIWYIQDGVLHFIFEEIFLPDSASDGPNSHGFVKFRMQPKTTLLEGQQIENVANIYFDFSEPVITDPAIFTVGEPYVELALKAFLGGPYDDGTGLMHDSLRAQGLIPTTEPYGSMGYFPTGPQETTIDPGILDSTGNDAIVDWVLIELREALSPTSIVRSRYALIQRDGDVVDVDGTSSVYFENIDPRSYHVLIWHRNHLAAMSAGPLLFSDGLLRFDITSPTNSTWGIAAQMDINGTTALWPGNVVPNAQIKYAGAGNDRDPILVEIGGQIPTATTTGYKLEDVNMDGVVKYAGTDNDRDPILETIGGTVPTAVKNEQVP